MTEAATQQLIKSSQVPLSIKQSQTPHETQQQLWECQQFGTEQRKGSTEEKNIGN